MRLNEPGPVSNDFAAVLSRHREWLQRMPWTAEEVEPESLLGAMTSWIDEYSEQFADGTDRLSQSIDLAQCIDRILNLFSGPCRAFGDGSVRATGIYQKVHDVLKNQQSNPACEIGHAFGAIRELYRAFGRNDGVRHCVLVSAIEAGHQAAAGVFATEFDGVRRRLLAVFAPEIGESRVEEVWQDVLTDMVVTERELS